MGRQHISNGISRIMHVILTLIIMLGIFSSPSFAEFSDEEGIYDVILEVKRDRRTLQTAIFGLEKNGKYYVPLQELSRIVKFKTDVSLENETANGFFILEENSFSLNVNESSYTLRGKPFNFSGDDVVVFKQELGIGDIYVTPELLNKIWPLDLTIDPLKQILVIQTTRKLPYEILQSRNSKRNARLNRRKSDDHLEKDLPKIPNNYRLFSLPALDFSSTTRVDSKKNEVGQNFNFRGRNDLFYAQADYNFSFDKEPGEEADFENARFLLERKSYDKGDMPLGLQLAQLGDVRPRPSRLIDGSLRGRGFLLSTESQKQIRDFDTIIIEGTAEPGWEVELYRNNELIGFQIVDSVGEYRFEDVTLNYNNTIIKTILYGPEGQVREEQETYNVAESMLKPGKTVVEVSALELNRDLFVTNSLPKNSPEGLAENIKVKRGINSWLSAFATFTDTPTRQKDRQYATIGANFTFLGIAGLGEVYKDLSGGTAYDLRFAGNYKGTSINVRNAIFSGFESEEAKFDGAARESRTEISLARTFKTFLGNLGLRFRLDNERFKTNPNRTELDFSQTYSRDGLRITHGSTINRVDGNHQNTDGRINATYRINPNWQLRSLLNYDVFPDRRFRNVLAELRYRDRNKFTAAIDVNRSFMDQSTRLGAQISYDFEKFRTGLNVDWDKDSGFRSFLRATFSMAPYGKNGDYIFSSKNLSNKAAYNGRVFLDKNYDGQFNNGDEIIEDAKINIGRRETNISDKSGYADYIGSPRNEYENISLDTDTLGNPFMLAGNEGISTVLRPATLTNFDFPVIETGLIDGTVEGKSGPLAGVRMQLVKNGDVIDSTTTAYDGFYTFEYIEPGSYIVQVDPSYEQVNIPPRNISVTSENLFQSGIVFQLSGQAAEDACTDEDSEGRITQNCPSVSVQEGMLQPAHTNLIENSDFPTIENLYFVQDTSHLKMVLDYDKEPNDYQVIHAKDNKEISIILSETNWNVKKSWENKNPKVLKEYLIEKQSNGDTKIILIPVNSIQVKASKKLEPDGNSGHRIHFDLIK